MCIGHLQHTLLSRYAGDAVPRTSGTERGRAGGLRLGGILSGYASTEVVVAEGQAQVAEPARSAMAPSTGDALSRWDTNGNGRIMCREARQHGIAPVHREPVAYRFMRDGNEGGVVCE